MYGASSQTAFGVPGAQGNLGAQVAVGTSNARNSALYGEARDGGSIGKTPWVLLGLVVIYIAWAWLSQGERIRESLSPANIAANVHNIVMVTIMAIIGIVSLKILLTKATAWGIPGAAWIGQIVAAV